MKYRFDSYEIDPDAYSLTRDGSEVSVEARVFETLILLIRERHRVVSKSELLETVWQVEFASEATLFKAIQQARRAVADDGRSQRLIKTVHGKGYRFVGEVEELPDHDSTATAKPTDHQSTPEEDDPLSEVAPVSSSASSPQQRATRWWLVAIAAAMAVGGAWAVWRAQRTEPAARGGSRPSVAVLGCQAADAGPDSAWMPAAVPELLLLRLRALGSVRLVAADESAAAVRDVGTPQAPDALDQLFRRLACDVIISSHLEQSADGSLSLQADVYRPGDRHPRRLSRDDPAGDLFAVVGEIGAAVAAELGSASADDQRAWTPAIPPDAFARYAAGLELVRDGDLNRAVSDLAPLVAQHPRFVHARVALAQTYQAMGMKAAASVEAQSALASSESLPAEDRMNIEALACELSGEWRKAARIYQSLASVAPDDPEYSLALIRALRWNGSADEALAIGRRVGTVLGDDPRLHLELSRVHQQQGAREAQRKALERACEAAETRGATGRLASAVLGLGWVDLADRDFESAEARFQHAEELFRSIGNRRGESRSFKGRAAVLSYGPNPDEALRLFEQAARVQRERGDLEDLARTLYSITGLKAYLGDLAGALSAGEQALEIARRTGDREIEGAVLVKIGDAHVDLGRPEQGMRIYLEARPILTEQGATRRLAALFNSMGLASEFTGNMAAAGRHLRRSAEMWLELEDTRAWFNAAYNLAWLHLRIGDLGDAEQLLEELRSAASGDSELAAVQHLGAGIELEAGNYDAALAAVKGAIEIRAAIGEESALASSRSLEHRVLLCLGRNLEALQGLEREIAKLRTLGETQDLATALLVLCDALGDAGRWQEAADAASQALDMENTVTSPLVSAQARLAAGRAEARLGRSQQAFDLLEHARRTAERSGQVVVVMEAEIALAELRIALGNVDEGCADLQHLQIQADRRGWGRLSLRAAGAAAADCS